MPLAYKPTLYRRTWTGPDGQPRKSPNWWGRYKGTDGVWVRVALYPDQVASATRLAELDRDAELRRRGYITPAMDARADHDRRPIAEHVADYLDQLRMSGVRASHLENATFVTGKLVKLARWKKLPDITADSMRGVVRKLLADGLSPSYCNKFITRGKALVHWLQADGRLAADPLVAVKRANVTASKKRRARRPLASDELLDLLTSTLPDTGRNATARAALPERQLAYAFAAYAGMRRGELLDLRWGDLRMNATVPFMQLREEQTKNGKADALPLHPYLAALLRDRGPGDDDDRIVPTVPDVKTLKKDLARVGIDFLDGKGRRADFHAFRHTLATMLSVTGASETNKRALMRHADESVTDGYSHARLGELADSLSRLPSPLDLADAVSVERTGTDDASRANVTVPATVQVVCYEGVRQRRTGPANGRVASGRAVAGTTVPSGVRIAQGTAGTALAAGGTGVNLTGPADPNTVRTSPARCPSGPRERIANP